MHYESEPMPMSESKKLSNATSPQSALAHNPEAMVVIMLCISSQRRPQLQIWKSEVTCTSGQTAKDVVREVIADSSFLRLLKWRNIKHAYKFRGQHIGPQTLVKTLLTRAGGRLVKLRLELNLGDWSHNDLARLINFK